MATSPRRSLVSRAGAAARKVVRRAAEEGEAPATKATKATAAKPAKQAASKKSAAKAPAKKAAAKKTPAKKASATKAPAKKASATKAPAKKAPATKAAPAKATTTKAAPKRTAASRTATPRTAATNTSVTTKKAPVTKAATPTAQKTAQKTATKKAAATRAAPTKAAAKKAGSLVVLEQEEPWTSAELAEVTTQLHADVERLTAELAVAEQDLVGLMREGSDGAGNDQADVGTATFERDQEMTVVHNAREMLLQSQHALERIEDGSYGVCENCGKPIGKNRLMAFPRATLCMTCKQREERR